MVHLRVVAPPEKSQAALAVLESFPSTGVAARRRGTPGRQVFRLAGRRGDGEGRRGAVRAPAELRAQRFAPSDR